MSAETPHNPFAIDDDDEEPMEQQERSTEMTPIGGGASTAAATTIDMVLDKHFPTAPTSPAGPQSRTTRITKVNQDAILQYDDLKLAHHVTECGTGTEADQAFRAKTAAEEVSTADTEDHRGLSSAEAQQRLAQYGRNELVERVEPAWRIFLTQLFCAPMPIMMWTAMVILMLVGNTLDAFILLVIQLVNATISFTEIIKAGNAVAALKSSLRPTATARRDGTWQTVDAAVLVPGDVIVLASGSHVPADCRILHKKGSVSGSSNGNHTNGNGATRASRTSSVSGGCIEVDQAALTGESLPVTFYPGDACQMGSTVVRGEVEAVVEFTGAQTFFGKTATLLQRNANERTHLQKILMTIMYVLVGLSTCLCLISFLYLLAKGEDVEESLSFTIVLLVASIPLAIEIVTTTTLAIGSKTLSRHGAIVAKLSAIEDLAGMSILCSDKTGTLTLNQMVLQEDTPIYTTTATTMLDIEPTTTRVSVLVCAAMAAKWNEPPRDALDRLTLGSVDRTKLQKYEQIDYVPFDPQSKRTEGTVRHMETGIQFKTSKGAPHIILDLLPSSALKVREQVELDVARFGEAGVRSLAVAKTDPNTGEWHMVGLLTFLDPPRPDTRETIRQARDHGVEVKMITGDHVLIARNTALQLELGDKIFTAERLPLLDPETQEKPANLSRDYGDLCLVADGFAQVYPEHKYLIVECLRELGYTVGMTGDGVNDAPALKRADIGIAVAGATDAARAAADIILTEEGLGTIIQGIVLSRHIFQRMSNFITYRISATLQLLLFFFLAVIFLHPSNYREPDDLDQDIPWPEFFHMPIIMMMMITLLNDGTLITIAYDRTEASQTPNRWNLRTLFVVSSVLGGVSCISSLILLHILLDSWNPNGLLHKIGIMNVQYGQIITSIYLKVSVSDFLTLFSARTGRRFFWQIKPASILLAGGLVALSVSSLLAIFWPDSTPDGILTEGLLNEMELFAFVWVFCLIFWLIQDISKVLIYKWMYRTNYGNISQTGVVILPESGRRLLEELDEASERSGSFRRKHSQSATSPIV